MYFVKLHGIRLRDDLRKYGLARKTREEVLALGRTTVAIIAVRILERMNKSLGLKELVVGMC